MAALSNHEQYLQNAANLTDELLQHAIAIVEKRLGAERAGSDGALLGAVLAALSENYRFKVK